MLSESSDDYGEEFSQPKTRKERGKGGETKTKKAKEPSKEQPKQAPTADLLDLGGGSSSQPQTNQGNSFQFDFMNSGAPSAPAQ